MIIHKLSNSVLVDIVPNKVKKFVINFLRSTIINYKFKARRPKYSVLNCEETEKVLNIKSIKWEKSLLRILNHLSKNNQP